METFATPSGSTANLAALSIDIMLCQHSRLLGRLGYHSAIRSQATVEAGSHFWRDERPQSRSGCGY